MRGNPGTEMPAVWSGLHHSSDSQPIFREGMASRAPQPQRSGPDLQVGREEAHPSAAAQASPARSTKQALSSSHPFQEGSAQDSSKCCTSRRTVVYMQQSPSQV